MAIEPETTGIIPLTKKKEYAILSTALKHRFVVCYKSIPGLVPVSTGVLKLWKPSVVRDHVKTRKLKLNAEDNLAYAA